LRLRADPIESGIVKCLAELAKAGTEHQWDDAAWTRELMERISELGRERGYWVHTSGRAGRGLGGWLFDLAWIDSQDGWVHGLPLALESEWANRGASDDFQKLLVCRAEHRVMVLVAGNSETPEAAIGRLLDEIANCRCVMYGDRFLFACWHDPAKSFRFELHVAGVGGGPIASNDQGG
jgi:hypothetical protein